MQPGRICPLHYRYRASDIARAPEIAGDTVYVVGGLYGNLPALEALLDLAARDRGAILVFNGDFNWFNVDEAGFRAVNSAVLRHVALRGNVETEIAGEDQTAGCGCAYPEWVSDREVECSNRISERLRATARRFASLRSALARLPMYLALRVGGTRIAVVHGDTQSLAGWGFAQEHLADDASVEALCGEFAATRCQVIASSHTCLPVAVDCETENGRNVLINNGAAGMPNFRGRRHGVITRISVEPAAPVEPIYATRQGPLHIGAVPLDYDHERWLRAFLGNWPPGSPAHEAYFRRIEEGPEYALSRANRCRSGGRGRAAINAGCGRVQQ